MFAKYVCFFLVQESMEMVVDQMAVSRRCLEMRPIGG